MLDLGLGLGGEPNAFGHLGSGESCDVCRIPETSSNAWVWTSTMERFRHRGKKVVTPVLYKTDWRSRASWTMVMADSWRLRLGWVASVSNRTLGLSSPSGHQTAAIICGHPESFLNCRRILDSRSSRPTRKKRPQARDSF